MPKEIQGLDAYFKLDASGLADTVLHCPECGKDHRIPIKKILVGEGLAGFLPGIAAAALGHAPRKTALIYDKKIEGIVLDAVKPSGQDMSYEAIPLGDGASHLDSTDTLGDMVAKGLHADVDLILGAGSGVISDLAKWIATKAKKPFILFGTAASMNAHASITATMTTGGVKTSAWLDPASAVLFDIGVIAGAPPDMRLAGLGDLAARSICNADWKLGEFMRGRYFCPVPYILTREGENRYLACAKGIGSGESGPTRILAEATLVSALSMTMMAGDTSASSGCEHVFSHYWDLQTEIEGAEKNLHGIQVGIGTMLSFALWDYMRKLDVSRIDPEALLKTRPSREYLQKENIKKFGDKAALFDEVIQAKWIDDDEYTAHVRNTIRNWDAMWTAVDPYAGDRERVGKALVEAGFDLSLKTIKRTRRQAIDALVYGARYRSRYTMLDLAASLGVLPAHAEDILDASGLA
jgi:glycerol-1-phosphate dehydrogenase [NAD(P)+]